MLIVDKYIPQLWYTFSLQKKIHVQPPHGLYNTHIAGVDVLFMTISVLYHTVLVISFQMIPNTSL